MSVSMETRRTMKASASSRTTKLMERRNGDMKTGVMIPLRTMRSARRRVVDSAMRRRRKGSVHRLSLSRSISIGTKLRIVMLTSARA